MLACLNDRPCNVCKFHTENGCARWSCVFEEEPDSEQAEVQAYFDRESFGWDKGRKALIEDIKAEIDKAQEPYQTNTAYDEGVRFGLMLAYQIVDRCKESEDT